MPRSGVKESGCSEPDGLQPRAEVKPLPTPVPRTVPDAARQACAQLVLERVCVHPLLEPARAAGREVVVGYDNSAVWAELTPGPTARLEIPRWWDGERIAKEDWARLIASALVKELKTQL